MTDSKNGKTIALVVIIVVLALFALRSAFILLPFGVVPGLPTAISRPWPANAS